MPPFPVLNPPLLNSACLWASTLADIETLYTSPYTGAVTTRTACHPAKGFPEDKINHQHAFSSFSRGILPSPPASEPELETTHPAPGPRRDLGDVSSLNTYGYAPLGLIQYVYMAKALERKYPDLPKPIIFSVTGDSETVAACWRLLTEHHHADRPWCMEINLSCPNIAGKPPPAYSKQQLLQFLTELREHISRHILMISRDLDWDAEEGEGHWREKLLLFKIPLGLKLPPYTYSGQFDDVAEVIKKFNSEGFVVVTSDTQTDATGVSSNAAIANMTERSIDPTLLSSVDVDTYVSDLTFDMEHKLSLGGALGESAKQTPANDTKTFAESFAELMITPLGRFIQQEIFGSPWPVAFVTATNTLGSCLLMEEADDCWSPALRSANKEGIGGLAGAALHPLALGNVMNLRKRLRRRTKMPDDIRIIGVGGVSDRDGFERMQEAGADVVGLATALGARGVAVFEDIMKDDELAMTDGNDPIPRWQARQYTNAG